MRLCAPRRRVKTVRLSPRQRDYGGAARALIARYLQRTAAVRRLSLILLRRAAHASTLVERHHRALDVTWQWQVVSRRAVEAGTRAVSGAASRPAGPAMPAVVRAMRGAPPALAAVRSALPVRIVSRLTRVEVTPAAASAPVAAHDRATAPTVTPRHSRPLDAFPLVTPRAPVVAAPGAGRTDRDAARGAEPADVRVHPSAPSRGTATPPIGAADLQRLASRVIASIDDRIAAARERLGRC